MMENGIAAVPEWIIDIPPTREGGREGIRQVLAMPLRPTAAVCYNDIVAFGTLGELGEHGLVVGRDFAITGFDGVAATAHSNPPLTTIDVRPGEQGAVAADMLLKRLADPAAPPRRHILEPRLVVRQSSGPPSA
jgi:LacI family transcriptional regulator